MLQQREQRVIKHPSEYLEYQEPSGYRCRRCGEGLLLPNGPTNYPNWHCSCGNTIHTLPLSAGEVVQKRIPPYVSIECRCGETHDGSPYGAADIICQKTKQAWNWAGQPLDWGALFGCVHYRMNADCDCGAGY